MIEFKKVKGITHKGGKSLNVNLQIWLKISLLLEEYSELLEDIIQDDIILSVKTLEKRNKEVRETLNKLYK